MKRALWIMVVFVAVGVLFFFALFEVEWRYPTGPDGNVRVHYTIPVQGKWMDGKRDGDTTFSFSIAGHVERVQLVPTSGHDKNGFVMLYIKTSEGWYETPTGSLGGPIDWERGVKVGFTYPEGMVLRKQTRSPIHGFYPAFGPLRWRGSPFGFGDHLDEGDVASVRYRRWGADGLSVTIRRTTGLEHSGGHSDGFTSIPAVEVTVSEREK